jgi:glycosyltransferase involved in cell wall biosynthesis
MGPAASCKRNLGETRFRRLTEHAMKICLVHNSYEQRGGEDVVFEQECAMLERAGHQVVVYQRSNAEIEQLTPLGKISLLKDSVWSTNSRRDFSRLLDLEAPDLVHVHNTFVMVSPSIYGACKLRGIPVVQTLHNYRWICPAATLYRDGGVCEDCVTGSLWNSVCHGCYRDSRAATAGVALMIGWHRSLSTWNASIDRYIALTNFSRDKFIEAGFSPDKIAVKPNFVGADPGPRTGTGDYAVYVGRLSSEKGLGTLIDAWQRLPAPIPLRIVGGGPERAALEAQVRQRRIPCVSFSGGLSHAETMEVIKGARFSIVPSRWYEGFPMVIAEAFACGVPVLCSRLGAMEEIVADQRTGLHFAAGDAGDLAKKAWWAWRHPSEISKMGRAARREYENKYTADKNYALLMEIYEHVLDRKPVAAAAFAR